MKIARTLFFVLFLSPVFLAAQFNWQALPNAPDSWRLDDMYFLTPQTGWAISPYYSFSSPNKYGQIYRTLDGGTTWQLQVDSSETYYRAVGFADSLNGWVGNLAPIYLPDTTPFYGTTDGGFTWQPVNNIFGPRPRGICGISVVTDSVVYAYGRYFGPPVLMKTVDKGATWNSQNLNAYGLIDGYFFDKDTGFVTGAAVGLKAMILSTFDGGATWQTRYVSTRSDTDGVWKISFPSRNIGYASIQNWDGNTPQRYFLKTTDGGLTWTEMPFLNNYNLQGIGFINDTVGWIGGDNVLRNYRTTDGGLTWSPDFSFGVATPPYISGTGYSVNRFRRFGDTLMYASGNTIYKMPGTLSGTGEGIVPGAAFTTNYPNPFAGATLVHYYLPENGNVTLSVSDLSGKMIFTEMLGQKTTGSYEYTLHLPGVAAGIYYCSITTENTRMVRKLMIINEE
jgi:photosystem II stability/assembly factor-like uncharacterized protein